MGRHGGAGAPGVLVIAVKLGTTVLKCHLGVAHVSVLHIGVFLELSNDENLLRKILLLTNGNFYEGSIDHIIVNDLIKHNLIIIPSQTTTLL